MSLPSCLSASRRPPRRVGTGFDALPLTFRGRVEALGGTVWVLAVASTLFAKLILLDTN